MKYFSWVLNGVLLLAVVVLYVLHFSNHAPATSTPGKGLTSINARVGLVNSDTVLKYYEYMDAVNKRLEAKGKKLQDDYQNRAQSLQQDINDYQRRQNTFTIDQAKAIQEDLMKKQNNLQMYEQTLSQEMADEQNTVNKELYDRVTAFLKKYGTGKGLNIVFRFDTSSDVLYAGDSLDITWDVIDGLNKEYRAEKGVGARKDSTQSKPKK